MVADEVDAGTDRAGDRRWLGALVVIVLFAVVTAVWAAKPFEDHVPLVLPERNVAKVAKPDELPPDATFECSPVVGRAKPPEPNRAAREALELQDLTREPCTEIRAQRRPLVVANVALAFGALGTLAWLGARRRARAGT